MFIKRKELEAMKEEIESLEFKNLCQEFMVETLKFINNNLKSGISNFPTKYLVEELENREAVEKHIAEPYQDLTVKANGPAIVLVITEGADGTGVKQKRNPNNAKGGETKCL